MKIGLALSGGGALGAAHVGALEQLEKNKIKIDQICGTSAGAIVGLLYSVGGVKTINLFYDRLQNSGIFERKNLIMRRNMTIFSKIAEILSECVGPRTFSDLNVKFSCIATNIITGQAEELGTGDPIRSVMASSAYPGVFAVQKIDDKYFVDGGLTLNLPAKTLKKAGSDFIVGSSLYSIPKLEKFNKDGGVDINLLDTAVRSIDILSKVLADYEVSKCDFCFTPPTEIFKWYEFSRIDAIKKTGEEYAESKIFELKRRLGTYKIGKGLIRSLIK